MATLPVPPPTYPSSSAPVAVACRPPSIRSLGSSSYRAYAPRRPSPLAEGVPTSRPSSVVLASPSASPPGSPSSLGFPEMSTGSLTSIPSMPCPKPTHSKSLPTREHTVRRPSTAPYACTPKSRPSSSSHHHHRRTQSTSPPAHLSNPPPGPARQLSAPEPLVSSRSLRPSTSRAPEENWMTSESAPRFTRESLVLRGVVLPVRKDDAQQLKRHSTLKSGAHVKYATVQNTASSTTLAVSKSLSKINVLEKQPHEVPSVRVVDVDGTIQPVHEVSVDLSKWDGTGKKNTPSSFNSVLRLSKDLAAKMKIRSGQAKHMSVTQEKGSDPILTEKLAVEKKVESGPHPRPLGMPSKRTKSIWGYIIGSSR